MRDLTSTSQPTESISRRKFIGSAAATVSALSFGAPFLSTAAETQSAAPPQFKLKYAPHFGMFEAHAGKDVVDQLKFMAEHGFSAMEDNGMMDRPVEEQERIAKEMARLNMTMGVFVTYAEFGKATFVNNDKDVRDMLLKQMRAAVEVAKRVHAKWTTVVPGMFSTRLEWDYQTANVIEHLKACAAVFEPHGIVMVLEPLNAWRDHPGLFLTKVPQAFQICRAVNSPSCKILDDLYHQQISEGNLIPNIDRAWSEIAYFQVGDNPGRKEPTTGEINYKNVFKHIHAKGFAGVVGMEHGNSKPGKEGELAVIDAYEKSDAF
ncbi:TIM barrel protein [candidate division KSB1 bacterium]|nr:TIM barrel protein [candidate division KSB1 bacterium]